MEHKEPGSEHLHFSSDGNNTAEVIAYMCRVDAEELEQVEAEKNEPVFNFDHQEALCAVRLIENITHNCPDLDAALPLGSMLCKF
ncbi:unnamed protein product [Mycena citricolor]|uniref:Uncharacterized protein n=1 Tax=Mycena citricolor TaxID=2018698 RepID=A0AAD2HQ74_9AGAR|nr:unnamed protein product [Mycena citricolor]